MPAPYSMDLRERVIEAWKEGDVTEEALATRFAVGLRTVGRWVARVRRTGTVAPDPMGGKRRAYIVDEAGAVMIREFLDTVPDTTHPELCAMYEETRGVSVSPQTMSDTVRRLGYTQKKGSSGALRPASRRR